MDAGEDQAKLEVDRWSEESVEVGRGGAVRGEAREEGDD